MSVWECQNCAYVYDPAEGDPVGKIRPGVAFDDLPSAWCCPQCKAPKDDFEPLEELSDDPALAELDDVPEDDGVDDDDDFGDDEPLDDDALYDDADEEDDEGEDEDELEGDAGDDGYPETSDAHWDDEDEGEEEDDEDDADAALDDEALAADDEALEDDAWEGQEDDDPEDEGDDEGDEGLDDDFGDEEEPFEDGLDDLDPEDEEEDDALEETDDDLRMLCVKCGYVYDPALGQPAQGVAPGTPFLDLDDDWTCPGCGASSDVFVPHEDAPETGLLLPPGAPALTAQRLPSFERLASLPLRLSARALEPSIDDLLLRPAGPFRTLPSDGVSTRTVIGSSAARPMQLSTPLVVAPVPLGPLTDAYLLSVARGTARVGAACSGGPGTSLEVQEAAAQLMVEVVPGGPMPSATLLAAADAAEVVLSPVWDLASAGAGQVVPSIKRVEELIALVEELRRSVKGPIGVRLAAGRVELDLLSILPASPDYVVLEGFGSGTLSAPTHVRDAGGMPCWLAVRRARMLLDARGLSHIDLLVAGDISSPAAVLRLLALGARAVILSTEALVAVGLSELEAQLQSASPALLDFQFEPGVVTERLVHFLRLTTAALRDLAAYVGRRELRALTVDDLMTVNVDLARLLGLPAAE